MAPRKSLVSLFMLVLAAVLFYGCAMPAPTPTSAQENFDQAQEDLRKGRYEEARYRFEKVVTDYPNSDLADDALFKLGYICVIRKEYNSARNYYSTLVEDHSGSRWKFDAQTWLNIIDEWAELKKELETAQSRLGMAERKVETGAQTENDTADRIQELQDEISRLREENNNLRLLIESLED